MSVLKRREDIMEEAFKQGTGEAERKRAMGEAEAVLYFIIFN